MKRCEFGHYYSDHLDACPYCNPGLDDKTRDFSDGQTTDGFGGDVTMVPEMDNLNDATVQIGSDESEKEKLPNFDENFGGVSNSDKTIIIDKTTSDGTEQSIVRPNRKLVGWLVSYTLDEMGYDFRLYEGKNVIGKKPGVEVPVLQDNSVSNVHATILFRNNKFLLRDEFSTNGTYLNGVMVEQDTPELKDGDIIKVGNTVFKFKVAIF